jgi:hypothetical protein
VSCLVLAHESRHASAVAHLVLVRRMLAFPVKDTDNPSSQTQAGSFSWRHFDSAFVAVTNSHVARANSTASEATWAFRSTSHPCSPSASQVHRPSRFLQQAACSAGIVPAVVARSTLSFDAQRALSHSAICFTILLSGIHTVTTKENGHNRNA